MQTIRARLSLSYVLVLTLGMALAGALAWLAELCQKESAETWRKGRIK